MLEAADCRRSECWTTLESAPLLSVRLSHRCFLLVIQGLLRSTSSTEMESKPYGPQRRTTATRAPSPLEVSLVSDWIAVCLADGAVKVFCTDSENPAVSGR